MRHAESRWKVGRTKVKIRAIYSNSGQILQWKQAVFFIVDSFILDFYCPEKLMAYLAAIGKLLAELVYITLPNVGYSDRTA